MTFQEERSVVFQTAAAVSLVIACSLALPVALTQVVSAQAALDSADRTIAETTVEPGQEVEITVSVVLGDGTDNVSEDANFAINEESFEPAFAGSSPIETRYNGNTISGGPQISTGELFFVGIVQDSTPNSEFRAGDEIIQTYSVFIPEDAANGQEYTIDGQAQIGDDSLAIDGDQTITVQRSDVDDGSSTDDGTSGDGTTDDDTNGGDDDGTDDTSTDDGTDDSSTDDGTDDSSTDDGTGDDGTTDDGTSDDGGSADDGSTDDGSDTAGDGSDDGGSDDGSTEDSSTDGGTGDTSTDDDGAGFGVVLGVLGVLSVAVFAARRRL